MALQAVARALPLKIGTSNSSSFDLLTYSRKRAEWANQQPGALEGYECERCKNRGYSMRANPDGTQTAVECGCMPIRRSLKRIERSGLSKLVAHSTFDLYQTPKEWQRKAKRLAQDYAKDPKSNWFLACGNAGSGKTHLCVAICRELMNRGIETRYALWRDTVTQLKAAVNDSDSYRAIMGPLKSVPLLYIDDFLKVGQGEKPTVGDVNIAFELINSRYNDSGLLTVISTERTAEELLSIDEATGSRIYERCGGFILKLVGAEKNMRLCAGNQ